MKTEREKLINELIEQIDKDLEAMLKIEDEALESNSYDDFINIAKRIDKVRNAKAALRSYGSSMISFDYVYGR